MVSVPSAVAFGVWRGSPGLAYRDKQAHGGQWVVDHRLADRDGGQDPHGDAEERLGEGRALPQLEVAQARANSTDVTGASVPISLITSNEPLLEPLNGLADLAVLPKPLAQSRSGQLAERACARGGVQRGRLLRATQDCSFAISIGDRERRRGPAGLCHV